MRQKTGFSVVEHDIKNRCFVCKMKAQIRGCLGQMAHRRQIAQWADTRTAHPMAHRRQIAQWSGTRTTHPGGTGFEPQGVALAVVVVRAGPLLQPGPG